MYIAASLDAILDLIWIVNLSVILDACIELQGLFCWEVD